MPFLAQRGLILAKSEVTYGTDPVPVVGTDAILGGNVNVSVNAALLDRSFMRDSISRLSTVVGKKTVNVTFTTELKGSGTAGTAPKLGPLLKACGMSETIVASTSVTYAPVSTGFVSTTIYLYMDGLLHKITGAFGTARIIEPVGEFARIEWNFTGLYATPTDVATPGGAVFESTKPQPVQGIALTFGAYAAIGANLTIDLGVTISERPSFNAADGLIGLSITNRGVSGSIDPEAVTEATFAFWTKFATNVESALAGNLIGSVAGNRVAITAPKVQMEAPQWGERNANRIYNIPLRFNPSTDTLSDEISIAFT